MSTNSVNGDGTIRVGHDSRRYMFATELKSGSRTEYVWDPKKIPYIQKQLEAAGEAADTMRQTLILKRAIVGPSAKENEINVVSVEVTDPDVEPVTFPLVYLIQGKESQAVIDMTFPEMPDVTVKFSLSQGSGPVHIIGYHFSERVTTDDDPDYISEADEDADVIEAEEDDDADLADDVIAKVGATAAIRANVKRRLNQDQNGESGTKKIKVGSENGSGDSKTGDGDVDMDKESEPSAVEAKEK